MNDLIKRQAAIDAVCLNNYRDITLVNGNPYTRGYRDGVLAKENDCIENIMNLPSAEPEQRWIPCSERLPEEDHWLGGSGKQFSDNVLVSIYNSDDEDEWVDVSQTIDGEWRIELLRQWKIVAWMPLPKPYGGNFGE